MASSTLSQSDELQEGDRVILCGLAARPELNGTTVTLLGWRGVRWAARTHAGQQLLVRPENLHTAVLPRTAFSDYSPGELLDNTRSSLPASTCCSLVDSTAQLEEADSVHGFLFRIVSEAQRAAGAACFYAHRTPKNAAFFDDALAALRDNKASVAAGW